MFSGFMVHTWITATVVALVAGAVGSFVVLRGAAFPAHAIPKGAFAGAAAANLLGFSTVLGLGAAALVTASGIGILGRRGRHDVATALALAFMLSLGAVFLSRSGAYEPALFALLFGQVLGVSPSGMLAVCAVASVCLAVLALLWRPLLLSSVAPEIGAARGVSAYRIDLAFLAVVALATALTVPVVGALLMFSLMVGPAAAARCFVKQPAASVSLSVGIAVGVAWVSIALSYISDWPVGFFVGTLGTVAFATGRIATAVSRGKGGPAPMGVPG